MSDFRFQPWPGTIAITTLLKFCSWLLSFRNMEVSAVAGTDLRLRRHLTSFQLMTLGFARVILLGALVLMLPIATVQRVWTPFHEALFTSTSAVCVTGLVVQDTGS